MNRYLPTFLVGTFASLCAVFVPRMVAMLNASQGNLQFFHRDFILVGVIFSLVIGIVTVIFEQGKQQSFAETFMAALGIPALLAGALSSGATGDNLEQLQTVNQQLSDTLAKKSGIVIEENPSTLIPLSAPVSQSEFSLISIAHAGDASQNFSPTQSLGIQLEQANYLIVLEKSANQSKASQLAKKLRQSFPKAAVVQSDQAFLVIDGEGTRSKSDALLKAIEIQNQTGLQPYLLRAD